MVTDRCMVSVLYDGATAPPWLYIAAPDGCSRLPIRILTHLGNDSAARIVSFRPISGLLRLLGELPESRRSLAGHQSGKFIFRKNVL